MSDEPDVPAADASCASSNAFPFVSRREVRSRIAEDEAYALECVATIQRRHERRLAGESVTRPCGWMSSHSSIGPELAVKTANGTATEEEIARAVAIVGRYSKQIALELRSDELRRRPDLTAVAARFGIGPTGAGLSPGAGAKQRQARPAARKTRRRPKPRAPEPPPSEPSAGTGASRTHQGPHGGCDVCTRVLDHLVSRHDQRSKDIADAIDMTPVDLAKHLRELVAEGVLVKEGHGRGTRYLIA